MDEIIFSSRDFRLRRQAFRRQADLSEIAAPDNRLKVTSFEQEDAQLENCYFLWNRIAQGEGNTQTTTWRGWFISVSSPSQPIFSKGKENQGLI